jgi:hypothetical protein
LAKQEHCGRNTTELREGGLRTYPVRVVTGRDQQLAGDVRADAEGLDERGRRLFSQALQMLGVNLHLLVDLEPSSGQ